MDSRSKAPLQWNVENFGLGESEVDKNAQKFRCALQLVDRGGDGSALSPNCGSSNLRLGRGSFESSLSTLTDYSMKPGKELLLNFQSTNALCKKNDHADGLCGVADTESSHAVASAVGLGEPLVLLKLGKAATFEDVCGEVMPSNGAQPSGFSAKLEKKKLSQLNVKKSLCRVDSCKLDLTTAKEYHRKHKVCEAHSKSPKVIVAGQECRFCQQCSRFHGLPEFDQMKRSCRRRLSHHNARRRKPRAENFSYGYSRFSAVFHDGKQQMNVLCGDGQVGGSLNPSMDSSGCLKITEKISSCLESARGRYIDEVHSDHSDMPSLAGHHYGALSACKRTNPNALDRDLEASIIASNSNEAPDFRCALSLLSNESCSSVDLQRNPYMHHHFRSNISTIAHPWGHDLNSTPGFWQSEPPASSQLPFMVFDHDNGGSNMYELQLRKQSYDATFDVTRMI